MATPLVVKRRIPYVTRHPYRRACIPVAVPRLPIRSFRSATTALYASSSSEQSSPCHMPTAEPLTSYRAPHAQTAAHAQSPARQSRDASRAPVTSMCEQTPCPIVQLSPGHGLTGISHRPRGSGGYSPGSGRDSLCDTSCLSIYRPHRSRAPSTTRTSSRSTRRTPRPRSRTARTRRHRSRCPFRSRRARRFRRFRPRGNEEMARRGSGARGGHIVVAKGAILYYAPKPFWTAPCLESSSTTHLQLS